MARRTLKPPTPVAPSSAEAPSTRASDELAGHGEPDAAATDVDWDALMPPGLYAAHGKRWLALLLIAVTTPVVVLIVAALSIANAVQLRSFSVFFFQRRVGRYGRPFVIIKFRTMADGDSDSFRSWGNGGDQARVTPFGRLLRRTHLDELPQLFNVVRGDMCLIGPRPELPAIERWAAEHAPTFRRRLVLRPGITGLAQITQGYTGMDSAAYLRKTEINEDYRRSLSLRADLMILARTVLWMLAGRGWAIPAATVARGRDRGPEPPAR